MTKTIAYTGNSEFVYIYRKNPCSEFPHDRKGHLCRILTPESRGTVQIEFQDGLKTICSRFSLRRA